MMKKDSGVSEEVLLPSEGESVAISTKEKTAALCYDRILIPRVGNPETVEVPKSIRCFGNSPAEVDILKLVDRNRKFKKLQEEENYEEIHTLMQEGFWILPGFINTILGNPIQLPKMTINEFKTAFQYLLNSAGIIGENLIREVAKSFSQEYGVPVALIYSSESERNSHYQEGDRQVVISTLCNLEIVDENELTWKQTLEFRRDEETRNKYKRFLHWLDNEMVGKSQAFIEDEISLRLEDYENALKKHGIKTVIGTIQETLDGTYLTGASAVTSSLSFAGHPVLGILAGSGLIMGKVGVSLAKKMLDFDDVERGPNYEVSWVYEAKKIGK